MNSKFYSKFFATISCLVAAVAFANINAEEVQPKLPYYKAFSQKTIALVGEIDADYTPLTFTKFKALKGDGIKPKHNDYQVVLEEGSYIVTFEGTFQAFAGSISTIDLTLQVGSTIYVPNTNSIETNFDKFQILTISQVVKIDKKKKLSIIARNTAPGTATNVIQRTLSIVRIR